MKLSSIHRWLADVQGFAIEADMDDVAIDKLTFQQATGNAVDQLLLNHAF